MLPQENLAPDKTLPTFCQNANGFNKVTWPELVYSWIYPYFWGPGSLALFLDQDKDKWVN